ncbi:MFS transporter [Georgenia satyanarayanai]|uniref:MFS transporter n=1 Tax=Georgenia satyanarayanai TaxID=860221 RepID=UPI00203CEDAB|nr:MFS transporter [Georgenia satyanarayanai]MCM3661994.1 MFS transporter [Georgenia satyanarayanai]
MTTLPVTPRPTQRRRGFGWPVYAWSLWDWGSAAFNAVITTFVFTVYITNADLFGPGASQKLGWALAGAGALIAVCAPVAGLRSDRSGRRTFWLAVNTMVVVVISASLFLVAPDPSNLWLGLALLAVGNIFFELASVNYYAMLNEISTPRTIGRISGLGWGLGYIGGIVLLLIVYFGLISPDVGLFGITSDSGMDVRVAMLICAGWTLLFSLPVLLTIRDDRSARERLPRLGVVGSYRLLFRSVRNVWRQDHHTVFFLGASAIFRDGLAGVFTFGGIVASTVFGFEAGEVIIFGVAANLVAGVATIAFGALDDILGPKRVIVGSLVAMILAGSGVFILHDRGAVAFWCLGLILCVFVGPAQSASRTFLARLIPKGKEGELFGLYATTGRAVSFLAPMCFALAISIGAAVTGQSIADSEYWGILGIVAVLTVGLLLLLPVRVTVRSESALHEPPPA